MRCIFRLFFVVCSLHCAAATSTANDEQSSGSLDVEPDDLKPGLVAEYRSLGDTNARLLRVDAKPAFHVGSSSPHPRIPSGPFEVVWTGVILLKDAGPLSFDADVTGELEVDIDGARVLQVKAEAPKIVEKKPLQRDAGAYRLRVRYRSFPEQPAGVRLWWQGPAFAREPLPAWNLFHLVKDEAPAVREAGLAERGRLLANQLGCARCHAAAFPGSAEPPPGPSLADIGGRIERNWLLRWLDDPHRVAADARMPALFSPDRSGFVERWIVAEYLLGKNADPKRAETLRDHRPGRLAFIGVGCAACHQVPDLAEQRDLGRTPLRSLGDKMNAAQLSTFLRNPHVRYPDARMPALPLTPEMATDIAHFVLKYSPATTSAPTDPPKAEEIAAVLKRLGARNQTAAGTQLLRDKGCTSCHTGLGPSLPLEVGSEGATPPGPPFVRGREDAGCLSGKSGPRFALDADKRAALHAYLKVARDEIHPSPFESRQRLLARAGCVRCHQRDSDRPPPIEVAGSTLGGGFLQDLPFQRTPRLTNPHQKFTRSYLANTVREGVSGLRPARYTYRMPSFGQHAEALVQALAEADGEFPAAEQPKRAMSADPTLGPLSGSALAGFGGYSCVSCHIWNGQVFSQPDPGAVGTDLTRVAGRIRRDWFDRFLDNPARFHPGTPMPAIFQKGKPATLRSILDGDPVRQKEALWSYFALGKDAPAPKPAPPLAIPAPAAGESPLVAQVPMHMPTGPALESISVLFPGDDLLIYDLGKATPHSFFLGGQILRNVQARLRTFSAGGTPIVSGLDVPHAWRLHTASKVETPQDIVLEGYDRLPDGVRIRLQLVFPTGNVRIDDSLRLLIQKDRRLLIRNVEAGGLAGDLRLDLLSPLFPDFAVGGRDGEVRSNKENDAVRVTLTPDATGRAEVGFRSKLPPAKSAPVLQHPTFAEPAAIEGSLERPGYRAVTYARPKTASGEDRIMPSALAVHPKDGRVFVASMKLGELFVAAAPSADGKPPVVRNFARGLFEEAYGMLAEDDGLYVLHRRNLTKLVDTDGDGRADRFGRIARLPHGIAATYDYGYGLAKDKSGAFIYSFAPYANRHLPGSGGAVRLVPGKEPQEIAFGFRNPVGWCAGPESEVFFSDNQGEWVATNKLCHLVEGRFYGFPNTTRKPHVGKPVGKTAVWVPYSWARSINGIAHDNTGGKFGPFAGQVFMAELMFGGAIVRANLEKVNGEYQGACFPFWGKGLLGPLALAFDPRGHLYVGGITEPGWMAQPDRGALFRIDYTGQVPFEMQSIHVLPRGFRIVFTTPVAAESASRPESYHLEHYRYEYSGAYGSPELDRTKVAIEKVTVAPDRRSVEVTTSPLVADRVYLVSASGVRSVQGESLVHATGAYTLNEIPK